MKRAFITFIAALTALAGASAQNYASVDDSLRYAGCDYVYQPVMRKLTPAPKGYKALTIQHYSRHGARYCWQDDLYTEIRDTLRKADSLGLLTPLGKEYRDKFEALFPEIRYHEEELTRKGWEQHRGIAEVMYKSFPEVFKGRQDITSIASNSIRCIMSMSSFCLSLSDLNPDLEIREMSGRTWYHGVIPHESDNPFRRAYEQMDPAYGTDPWKIKYSYYDNKGILSKLFKDAEAVVPENRQCDFLETLYYFANGMQSLDTDANFAWIFSREERHRMWEIDNFKCYDSACRRGIRFVPILEDIIAKGDAHLAEGRKGADLRFGHDTCLIPLLLLIGINGYDQVPDNWEKIQDMFQNWNIPMGGNIQIVLYTPRGAKRSGEEASGGGEPLFKILLNGEEATLPAFEPVSGPYYRWSDLKARAEELKKHLK